MRTRTIRQCGAVLGLLAFSAVTRADEAEAIAALKKLGGTFIHVGNNPKKPVRSVYLPGSKVTDADLKYVAALPQIEVLKLDAATKITDDGLKELVGLKHLKDLGLGSTQVTDAGLKHVIGHKGLENLNLNFTKVTDNGVKDLAALTKLKLLGVSFTSVTPEGVKKLQKALPKCKITR
jgi:hypothetical protein